MIPRKFTILISTLLLCLPIALSAENRGMKIHVERLALVIGNSAYQTAPLKNPLNDAEDMAATLESLDFKVILKKNADQRTMEDTIRYFGRQLKNGGVGLFYFAGHGLQVEGRNYLVPVDARIESESDVRYEAVDAGRVLGKMEDAENQLNIVILDACRNNPYARSFRTDQKGLARMDAPTGSLVAYATAPGDVAADGNEKNGIFTKYLIRHMSEPNLSIEQVLKRVRIDVAGQTNGRQIPWESSSLMGDFYFNSKKPSESIHNPGSKPVPLDEKTSVAAKVRTKTETWQEDSRSKLAIFPMYQGRRPWGSGSGEKGVGPAAAIDSLRQVLKKNKRFVTTHSFYEMSEGFGTKLIDRSIINEKVMDGLWVRKSIWSSIEPNFELIYDLCNKLGIDFAVTYRFLWDDSGLGWDSSLYIIDVKNKKIFSKNGSLPNHSSAQKNLINFTEKVFLAHERENF